jgi:hypothetical protein
MSVKTYQNFTLRHTVYKFSDWANSSCLGRVKTPTIKNFHNRAR